MVNSEGLWWFAWWLTVVNRASPFLTTRTGSSLSNTLAQLALYRPRFNDLLVQHLFDQIHHFLRYSLNTSPKPTGKGPGVPMVTRKGDSEGFPRAVLITRVAGSPFSSSEGLNFRMAFQSSTIHDFVFTRNHQCSPLSINNHWSPSFGHH